MKYTKIEFIARLPFKSKNKGKYFLTSCPIFDVHSQGETEQIAKENLVEALSLFFLSCFERGVLDSVLKECGFKTGRIPIKETKSFRKYLDVPIPLVVNERNKQTCRV